MKRKFLYSCTDIIDSSGLQLTYSSIPRTFEAGVLQVGHAVSKFMIVPPGTNNFDVFGDCSSHCTSLVCSVIYILYSPPEKYIELVSDML